MTKKTAPAANRKVMWAAIIGAIAVLGIAVATSGGGKGADKAKGYTQALIDN